MSVATDAASFEQRLAEVQDALRESAVAEARLSASADKYQALFTSVDDGFCIIEFIDGPDGPLSD